MAAKGKSTTSSRTYGQRKINRIFPDYYPYTWFSGAPQNRVTRGSSWNPPIMKWDNPSYTATIIHHQLSSMAWYRPAWPDILNMSSPALEIFLLCYWHTTLIVPQGHLRVCLYNFVLSVKSSNITRALIHYLATSGALQANVSNLEVQQLCFWTSVKAAVSDIFVLK